MTNLDLLRSLGSVEQFQKNQTVFEQNDEGDMMYIVLKGVYGVYINSFTDFPVRVAAIKQGSFFGEMAVIDGWPRSAAVVSEEDGAVLVIKKKNFTRLLEKSPDICASMLETMQNRAAVTAASFADVGKSPPELPERLMKAKFSDANAAGQIMTMLARQIRQMNALRSAPAELPEDQPLSAESSKTASVSSGAVKLLPDGYAPYNLSDINDNTSMLHEKKLSCPYCGAAFEAYIPLFPSLVQKRASLDGRVIYENFDILWYTNIVCPHCNYTDAYQEFGARRKTSSARIVNRFSNAENFAGFAKTHRHTLDEVILSFYQSLDCLKETTNNPLRFGKAWLRLYWLYCDHGPKPLMLDAAEKARSYYTRYQSMKGDLLVADDKMRVNAILGELSAALGDCERALECFKANTIIGRLSSSDILQGSLKRYGELRRTVR